MCKKLTPNLMVEDVNKTVDFYTEVIGFNLAAAVPEDGPFDWAMVRCESVDVMFQRRDSLGEEIPELRDKLIGGSFTLYFDTTNTDGLYAKVKDRVTVVQELHTTFYGKQEFTIKDCNGYILVFAESKE